MSREQKTCFICGKKSNDHDELLFINGEKGAICEECVEKCMELLEDYSESQDVFEEEQDTTDISKPSQIKDFLDQYVIGQDVAKKKLAVAVYNHFKMLKHRNSNVPNSVEIKKSNVLLLGSTGSGKTYLLETLAKMLDIPLVIADATSLTQAGYVGDDPENMIRQLVEAANFDIEKAERGIIYIDEIDKLTRKGESTSITRDVGGEGVQQAILKMIEGTVVETPMTKGRKHPDAQCMKINTSNILFIGGGSFEGVEKIIQKRVRKTDQSAIGFGSIVQSKKDDSQNELITQVTVEDLKKFGMIPELLGRFPVIAYLEELDREALIRILTEPKDALVKQYAQLLSMDGIRLTFEQEALEAIADLAIERKTGARALRGIMEDVLNDIMFDAPNDETVDGITITKECVTDHAEPKFSRTLVG